VQGQFYLVKVGRVTSLAQVKVKAKAERCRENIRMQVLQLSSGCGAFLLKPKSTVQKCSAASYARVCLPADCERETDRVNAGRIKTSSQWSSSLGFFCSGHACSSRPFGSNFVGNVSGQQVRLQFRPGCNSGASCIALLSEAPRRQKRSYAKPQYLMGLMGVHLYGRASHGACISWAFISWACSFWAELDISRNLSE
jgi:hypothetical protein